MTDYKYKVPTLPKDLKDSQTDREARFLSHIKQLEELLRRDYATGLYHKEEHSRSTEGKKGVTIYIDGDNLKLLNDLAQSHEVGDTAIKSIGKAIRQSIESAIQSVIRGNEAIASRMGGDEFAIFLPGLKDLEVGKQVAERILDAIREKKINHKNFKEPYQLTASMGVGYTRDEADKAMYQAKANGRNRVEVYKNREATLKFRIAKRLFDRKQYSLALRVLGENND